MWVIYEVFLILYMTFSIYSIYIAGILRKKCVYVEDGKTLYTFGPPGFSNGKLFFPGPLSRIFWIQKIFN